MEEILAYFGIYIIFFFWFVFFMLHITKRVIHHQIKIGYSKQQFVTLGDFFYFFLFMCISRVIERRFIVMGRIIYIYFYTER